jgi:hypothetical protein
MSHGHSLSRFAVGLSESSELFGSFVTSTMGPEQSVVKSDLHGVSSEADADGDPDVAVAHPIPRSEAHPIIVETIKEAPSSRSARTRRGPPGLIL